MPDPQLLTLRLETLSPGRLDQLLLARLREELHEPVSRAQLKFFFRTHSVRLDGSRAEPATEVSPGRHSIELCGWDEFATSLRALTPAPTCFLPILYEDDQLLVLNKSSGVPSVALSGTDTQSAAAAALAHSPELAHIPGAKPLEPGLVHRLDTGTSGVLVFAKSGEELARLRAAWKTPAVRKFYRAIVKPVPGAPSPRVLSIRLPLAHSADSSKRMLVLENPSRARGIRGKPLPAVTHILAVHALADGLFELELEIETGLMHQIRAHLSYQGWPILGDRIYRGTQAPRLMLHAERILLPLNSGAELAIECPFPENPGAVG